MSTRANTLQQRREDLREQLAAALEARDRDETKRLREELTEVDLRIRGREIGATLAPPSPEKIANVAELLGAVVTERNPR